MDSKWRYFPHDEIESLEILKSSENDTIIFLLQDFKKNQTLYLDKKKSIILLMGMNESSDTISNTKYLTDELIEGLSDMLEIKGGRQYTYSNNFDKNSLSSYSCEESSYTFSSLDLDHIQRPFSNFDDIELI
jgi:hypothetical protein